MLCFFCQQVVLNTLTNLPSKRAKIFRFNRKMTPFQWWPCCNGLWPTRPRACFPITPHFRMAAPSRKCVGQSARKIFMALVALFNN